MAQITKNGSQFAISTPEYAVICCDSDDQIISWDVQAERLFGWNYSEALGQKLFDLIFPKGTEFRGKKQLSSLFFQYRKEVSVTLKIEEVAHHRDGQHFSVELLISPLPGGDFFTIFIRNIRFLENQKKKTEERAFKLKIQNTIFKMALEPTLLKERLARILSYIVSLETLNLLPMAALFLVEQDTKTLVLNVKQGFPEELEPTCTEVPFGHCSCGKAALSNQVQFVAHGESHSSIPHGHYCVPIATHGIVLGVISFFIPDSHRRSKKTEEVLVSTAQIIAAVIDNQKMDLQLVNLVNDLRASILDLREEKSFSESVIQGLEHGLIVTDSNGVVQKCNDVAITIFSDFTETIEGQNLISLIGRNNANRILTHNSHPSESEENELTLTTIRGDELILRYSAVTRTNSLGQEAGLIISLTDISEWRYVRKEMEKMNRLSTVAEIASAVAHEVRNPLAGIKIMAQSIEEDSGSEEERIECSQRIVRQVDRLNELLTDFFSYARPIIPKKQSTSLENILAETKPLIVNKLVKQRIVLIEDFQENLPPVIADPNQVQQVFLNLFLNAVDAIKQEGTIEIQAQVVTSQAITRYRKANHQLRKATRYVMVLFRDNGAGMSREAAEKVFEPFYTTKTNGSGLGMSIVYRTLKENDAAITVESREGKGTTFTMFFKSG